MNSSQENSKTLLPLSPDGFEAWINERPRWLQSAAAMLIDIKRIPNHDEIVQLSDLCIKEVSGEKNGFSKIIPGALAQASIRPSLHISKIADVSGINAIRKGASLAFGSTNLAVIYGANGTGKTGFSRLLKQACGAKAKDDLLGNVFSNEVLPATAQIEILIDDKLQKISWTLANGASSSLRHVHVFDTKTAQMYMGKNEATYEPSRMRFVSSLISICDLVSVYLGQQKNLLISKLPNVPPLLNTTNPILWLNALTHATKPEIIEQKCQFSKELDNERVKIEGALSQKDILGRLQSIGQERLALQRVKSSLSNLKSALTNEVINALIVAKSDAAAKRTIANEDAKKVFANVALEGVGQSTWIALWGHAKQFSEQHAYPNFEFPFVGDNSRCVLCQQELAQDGKKRMNHFQAYIRGALESDAKTAEVLIDDLSKKLPVMPVEHDWMVQMSVLKLAEDLSKQYLDTLTSRRQAIDVAKSMSDIPVFDWEVLEKLYQSAVNALDTEEKTLKGLQQDGQRQSLESRLKELQAIQWLSQNKLAVLEERARLLSISKLESAIKLVGTHALTKKNNELAQFELDAGYQQRFADELKRLGGARLPVKPQSKKEGKGKITFGLALQGSSTAVPAERILSQGETRIVALAAFIADITGSGQKYPFVFDDPISSLDQDFEERVVARLVDLARDRQVIVFTHRLSLLSLIESSVRKLKDEAKEKSLPIPVLLTVETLRKLGSNAGVVSKLSLRDSKPVGAVARIKDEFIPQLKKHLNNGDAESFEVEARQICSEIRILVERCVEYILLNEVLVRFRRDIQTKGRLSALTKIEQKDCDLLDDLMTRYSVFEHSQSDELPAPMPDLSLIEQDMDNLSAWIESFNKPPAK